MDGGRVFRSLLERRVDFETATRRAARLGRSLAVVLVIVGVFVNVWLVLIGAFVYLGASAEETATLVHLRIRGRRVRDAMLLDPLALDVDATVEEVEEILRHTTQRWFPIIQAGRCVGVLDVDRIGHLGGRQSIADRVVRCEPLDAPGSLEDGLERLQTDRLSAIPVVSAGKVVGLLRIEDVAHLAARAPSGDPA
jgi:predicted transcriptional regulator